ncbi:MAG: metal-dependent transcriptional regulator [Bacteroidales bacterium]|nr:metal-dependent transcriptional regulator [Bacteroidales bacterium]
MLNFLKAMSISTENFIKTIYALEFSPEGRLKSADLAYRLQISKSAVTDMLRKLRSGGLINYEKYSSPSLTKKGKQMALQIIRKHRLWETFLHKHLNIPWENVHEQAEMLEHASSDYLTDHLDNFMGRPAFDPHGDPIPDADGNFQEVDNQILFSDVSETGFYRISRINDNSTDLLSFFKKHKLNPGNQFEVIDLKNKEKTKIKINKKTIIIDDSLKRNIYITKIKSK